MNNIKAYLGLFVEKNLTVDVEVSRLFKDYKAVFRNLDPSEASLTYLNSKRKVQIIKMSAPEGKQPQEKLEAASEESEEVCASPVFRPMLNPIFPFSDFWKLDYCSYQNSKGEEISKDRRKSQCQRCESELSMTLHNHLFFVVQSSNLQGV